MDIVVGILVFVVGLILVAVPIFMFYLIVLKLVSPHLSFRKLFISKIKNRKAIVIVSVIAFVILVFFSTLYYKTGKQAISNPPKISVQRLIKGKIGYNVPDTMKVGIQVTGIVTITKALNDSILFLDLDSSGFNIEEIKVSSRVKVTLMEPSGEKNFSITAKNSEEQSVDDSSNTIWKWNITPLSSGKNALLLRATVKLITDIGETQRDVNVFEKAIYVKASPAFTMRHFISEYWQWILGTLLIPLLIWLFNRWKNYKQKKKENEEKDKKKITGFGRGNK